MNKGRKWYTNSELEQFKIKTNNRGQCWTCKHRENFITAKDEKNPNIEWKIPVCDAMGGMIMLEVYNDKCRRYELLM